MGLFKPIKVTWRLFFKNVLASIVFPIPMYFIFSYDNFWIGFWFNFALFFAIGTGNGYLSNGLNVSWLENPLKAFLYHFFISFTYTIISSTAAVILISYIFYGQGPTRAFQNIGDDFYLIVIAITTLLQLIGYGNAFLHNWRRSELQAAELREAQISAKYESLQNQVNPHFLFNSLNVLSTLVYKDPDVAATFIKQLSRVYRYVLEAKNQEVVPLETELEALEAYFFLLKIRFKEGLEVQNNLKQIKNCHIAPLSLQMLVENAVKHNTVNRDQALQIKLYAKDDYLFVENNLQKKSNQQESMGIGLSNIQKRYQYLSDNAVLIEETATHFKVGLPVLNILQNTSPIYTKS